MKKSIKNYLKTFAFDEQIFIILMFFMAILALLLITENIAINYPFEANYKWFGVLALSLLVIVFSLRRSLFNVIKVSVFTALIFVLLPYGWLSAGLNNGYTIAYSFLILICTAFFFKGKARFFFMIGELAVILSMVTLTVYMPDIFLVPDQEVMVVDFLVQVPLTYITAAILLSALMNAYYREHNRIIEYAALLDSKNKELIKMNNEDELTGIYNRRFIFETLEEIKQMGFREKLVLGILEIDSMRSINDELGHAAGDRVIKQIARDLTRIVGSSGLVGRFGGVEFMIIVFPGPEVLSLDVIEKIRKYTFESVDIPGGILLNGAFIRCSQIDDVDRLIIQAGNQLTKAKSTGSSQLTIEDF